MMCLDQGRRYLYNQRTEVEKLELKIRVDQLNQKIKVNAKLIKMSHFVIQITTAIENILSLYKILY